MSAREITIDQITKLATRLAEVEYQRGYADGLNEKKATEKHWGKQEKSCDTCVHRYCNLPFICRDKEWYKEDKE